MIALEVRILDDEWPDLADGPAGAVDAGAADDPGPVDGQRGLELAASEGAGAVPIIVRSLMTTAASVTSTRIRLDPPLRVTVEPLPLIISGWRRSSTTRSCPSSPPGRGCTR